MPLRGPPASRSHPPAGDVGDRHVFARSGGIRYLAATARRPVAVLAAMTPPPEPPLRVAVVINSLGAGGTERSTAVLLPHLRAWGIDATVVCLVHRDEGDEASVIAQGFDVRFIGPGRWLPRVAAVRRVLREVKPDVVHTAIFEADVVGRLAAAGTGMPVLSSLVNTPYDPSRRDDPNVVPWKLDAVRRIDSLTGRLLTARFHAVTPGVRDDAVATLGLPATRIDVVERGRDPDQFGRRTPERRAEVREALGLSDEQPLVVAVGRQEFQKGHVHLIEAMARLVAAGSPAVAVIAGRSGNATAAITEALDGRRSLQDRVRLLGHRDDIADLLAAADVFVMPSLYEGTAGAAVEAFALEAPVVAADLTGTRGILVDGDNAWLVPMGDPAALAVDLADAIAAVLADPAEAASRAARGRRVFEERFTLTRSADRMAALYRSVAAAPARPRRVGRSGR